MAPDRPGASWWVLVALAGAQFLVVLDVSVVNVALPTLTRDLDLAAAVVPWVANAYAVVLSGLLLLGGRLGDVLDRRRVFLVGLVLFTAASVLGGLARGPVSLVTARALQGVGAALVAPTTLALLRVAYPAGPRRTRALAVWSGLGSLGGAAGSLVGGLLTDLWSWRAVLLVNVLVGAVLVPLAVRVLPPGSRSPADPGVAGRRALDLPGALCAALALGGLALAVGRLGRHGWDDATTLVSGVVALLALAALVRVELTTSAVPLLPLRLLRLRSVSVGNVVMLLSGACLQIPVWYFLTFFMQDVLHLDPLRTGLGFLPHTLLGVGLGVTLTPWLMARVESRVLVAVGALVTALGFWWQSAVPAGAGYLGAVLPPAVVLSLGSALFVTPLTSVLVGEVAEEDVGAVSGLLSTAKQAGGVLGLAALAVVAGDTSTSARVEAATGRVFGVMAAVLVLVAALAALLPRDPSGGGPGPGTDRRRPRPRRPLARLRPGR